MENYMPRINVHILTGDRKGFKVYSTLVEEREYALACIYKKGVNNEGREGFLVFEELENLEGEVFYRSDSIAFFKDEDNAGSFCYGHGKNTLGDRMADFMRGEIGIEGLISRES